MKKYISILLVFIFLFTNVQVYATQSKVENFSKAYTLIGNYANDIVTVANAQLEKTKANLGYTEAWCADFVSDCAKLANIPDNIIPHNYSGRGACTYLYNYMVQNCGAVVTSNRQTGDFVFYYCSGCGRYVHVGIVKNGTTSIEGNYGGKVSLVTSAYTDSEGHTVASGTVRKVYLRPNYGGSPSVIIPPETASTIMHLDSPKPGYTYEGANNIEISGWLASNSEPGYIMSEISGYGQTNLSFYASPSEAASYPNHKYFYRFSGAIDSSKLSSNTNYTIRIFSGISDGTYSTTFNTGALAPAPVPSAPTNCVVHVDAPNGEYSGYRNIEITGWIASNTSPGYIMAEINGYGQINLSFFDSPSEAGAQPNYTYFKRFRGVIEVDRLASFTTYNFKVFSNVQDSPYQASFSTGNVEPLKYAISFNANGGSGAPSGIVVNQGKSGTIPNTVPIRYGYNFLGWSTSSSDTTAMYSAGSSISPSSNMTLYAVWSAPLQYTLQFNANGGSGAPSSLNITYGTSGTVPYTIPQKFPNTFLGWSEDREDVSPSYKPGESVSPTYNTTLYAIWAAPITLSTSLPCSANGSVDACGTYRYFKFTPNISTSYTFESCVSSGDVCGYLYDSSGNELLFNDDGGEGNNFSLSYELTAGKTYYYATKWFSSSATGTIPVVLKTNETIYTVSYDANGGIGAPATQYKTKDETITLSTTIPSRFGYTFAGWAYTGFDTATHMPGQTYGGSVDLKLTAVWESAQTFSTTLPCSVIGQIDIIGTTRYFKFTPSVTDTYIFESIATSGDPYGYLYDTSGGILCSNDDTNERNFVISYKLIAGNTYYFAAKWYSSSATGEIPVKLSRYQENISYTVTYDYATNGGTSADKTNAAVADGEKADLTVVAKKEPMSIFGDATAPWEFVGWNTNKDATTALSSYTVTKDVTLYAIFKRNVVASFYAIDSETLQTTKTVTLYNIETSKNITLPTPTACLGWNASGWRVYNKVGYCDYVPHEIYALGSDTVFYSSYNRTLTLSYNANGGSSTPQSQTATQSWNAKYSADSIEFTVANAPVKSGYVFGGWALDSVNGEKFNPGETICLYKSSTLYATWKKDEPLPVLYTLTYNYSQNGGTSATKTSSSVESGSNADLTPTATKSGWEFVGWNTDKNATTALSSYTISGDVTLYAIYKKTISAKFYYGNNYLQTTKNVTLYNNGTSGNVTLPTPSSYSGWTVSGWRDDTTAESCEYRSGTSVSISKDMSFYAVYSRTLTLSYNANGGSAAPSDQTATQYYNAYGTKQKKTFTLASAITKTDWVFNGWAVNSASGTVYSAGDTISIEDVTTMYAVWAQNISWTLDDTGTLTITGSGPMPNRNSYKVPWYEQKDSIKKIVIGTGITSIGDNAFAWCNYVESVTIPNSVISIGREAFYNCVKLNSLTIPQTVTTISETALSNCDSLTDITVVSGNEHYCSVDGVLFDIDKTVLICYPAKKTDLTEYEIPSSVTKIPQQAFYKNTALTNIIIPETVTAIGDFAFYQCSALTEMYIPENVNYLGNNTFSMCYNLKKIDVDPDNEYYASENGVLFDKSKTVLYQFPCNKDDVEQYVIPSSVVTLSNYSFRACHNISSIVIPKSVKTIEYYTFYSCSKLKDIYYCGTQSQWTNDVDVDSGNSALTNATMHYNYVLNHTVTYNHSCNGGTSASKTTSSVSHGSQVDLTPTATKSGWTFVGWNTDPGAITGLTSYEATSDVTLYAIYRKTLTATFYCGGNSIQTTKTVTIYNNVATGSITTPTLSAYSDWVTVGWRDDTTASSKEYSSSESVSISSDTKFYGVYSKAITLSYDANGGSSAPSSQTVTQYYNACGNMQNVNITITSIQPTRSGYTFLGWSTNSSATMATYSSGSSYTNSSSATLYAVWKQNPPATVEVESVSLNKTTATMCINETVTLTATISPSNATNKNITWTSSQESVATVSQSGVVTAISSGTATITVTTADGKYTDTCLITVIETIDEEGLGGSGTDSNGINWYLYEAGLLKFSGNGDMQNYSNTATIPWYGEKSNITEVEISDGITHIGDRSFYNCISLKKITIPKSVASIGTYAFRNCSEMTIYAESGTYTETYAKANGIPFVDTKKEELKTIIVDPYGNASTWCFDISIEGYTENAMVYAGIYDENGKLLAMTSEDFLIDDVTTLTIKKSGVTGASYVKIFVWKSNLKPIANAVRIGL